MERKRLTTDRLTMSYVQSEAPGKPKLVLVHGNASSSKFYRQIMEMMEGEYDMIAPDLRAFGESDALPIDATRGMRDHADDLYSLLTALGWDRFAMLGWSMGGGVIEQYAIDHPEQITGLILEAPMPPYGIGATWGPDGKKLKPEGIGTGAAGISKEHMAWLTNQDREAARAILQRSYVTPDFHIPDEYVNDYIDGMLEMKIGKGMYPGDKKLTLKWPGMLPGKTGIINSMSGAYVDTSALADNKEHFPILWMWGTADTVVADESMSDVAVLGKKGLVKGWPGEEKFPPQPMTEQTRYMLKRYEANGGSYREVPFEGVAHGIHMMAPERFTAEIREFLG